MFSELRSAIAVDSGGIGDRATCKRAQLVEIFTTSQEVSKTNTGILIGVFGQSGERRGKIE